LFRGFAATNRFSMYQHEKIQPLYAYLSQAGFNVPLLEQTLLKYIEDTEQVLKVELNHYDHTFDYIDARGFLNEVEAFVKEIDTSASLSDRTSMLRLRSATDHFDKLNDQTKKQ
jgi:hypothetical protein